MYVCMCMYVCMYICTDVCMHVCTYVCVCIYICMNVCIYEAYVCTDVCMYVHKVINRGTETHRHRDIERERTRETERPTRFAQRRPKPSRQRRENKSFRTEKAAHKIAPTKRKTEKRRQQNAAPTHRHKSSAALRNVARKTPPRHIDTQTQRSLICSKLKQHTETPPAKHLPDA